MKILLVEPNFPIPPKSKNHKNFLPIGLLKLHDYYKSIGYNPKLVRGNKSKTNIGNRFKPKQIMITSLFTYWSRYVKESVEHYKKLFPKTKVIVGGIYASLMPKHCKQYTRCDEVYIGIHKEAESYASKNHLNYKILDNPEPIDYQIIHASRGCIRKCQFCGTWKIEPTFEAKRGVKDEIKYSKLVFYDNNLLANPHIENILNELIELKRKKEILWCESQSGYDGRELEENPHLGKMIKKAGFRYPRIAWDWDYNKFKSIKEQIEILVNGGCKSKDIFIFMLYNWDMSFKEMEKKRIKCGDWQVQIADCRYRPLNQTFDDYDPRKNGQTNRDYYIHEQAGWTDELVKQFRRNVRRQNICVRHGFPFYSKDFEHKRIKDELMKFTKTMKTKAEKIKYLEKNGISYWFPDKISYPSLEKA